MHKRRIAIVGAGPGGLTLARILHIHGIRATVFEREKIFTTRSQGGSLDMHAETGQYAIARGGLCNEFRRIARYEDQESRLYDKHGALLLEDTDVWGKFRPEVDRGQLRQMLLDSLPPGMVRWGQELSTAERFDLVVGADGAWSRTRALVSNVRPIYSGVSFVEMGIDDADIRHPELARLVGRGLTFALGDSKALIAHRDAGAHLSVYAALRAPENQIEATKAGLAAHFTGWSESLLELIHRSGERMTPRTIHALPVGMRWEHRPGVTLIGDAAHLMSPWGGHGANLAMRDAVDLGLALAEEADQDSVVRRFEAVMFERAEEAAAEAAASLDEVFSEGGLASTLRALEGHRQLSHAPM